MHWVTNAAIAAVLTVLAAPPALTSQTRIAVPPESTSQARSPEQLQREDWQRVPDIFAALGAKPGSRIADLGAGEGWLTLRLATEVEASGRVFASDISERALSRLSERIDSARVRNVELMLAEDDDPRLPHGTLDGVVILNAYHEMTKRVPVLEGVKQALKPGGVLVIVDNTPPDSLQTRREQTARHTLSLELARDDLEAQGFDIVSSEPDFITREHERHTHREWMLVARRPSP